MQQAKQRYLLLVEYADAAMGQQGATSSYYLNAGSTALGALLPLFSISIDQFHPDAALLRDQKTFVRNATLLDLFTGKPVVSTIYKQHGEKRPFEDVHLVLERGVSPVILHLNKEAFGHRASLDEPAVADLVKWDLSGEFLVQSPLYKALFRLCLQHGISETEPLVPYFFQTQYQGVDVSKLEQTRTLAIGHMATITHLFPSIKEATLQLILTPPAAFDPEGITTRYGRFHYTIGTLIDNVREDLQLAKLSPYPLPTTILPAGTVLPVQYLSFNERVGHALASLGIQGPYARTLDGDLCLPIDQVIVGPLKQYVPSAHFAGHRQRLASEFGLTSPSKSFEVVVQSEVLLPAAVEQSAQASVIDLQHLHTDKLMLALFEALVYQAANFGPERTRANEARILQIEILDQNKQSFLRIYSEQTVNNELQLMLAISDNMVDHPDLQHYPLKALLSAGERKGDGLRHIQVGHCENDKMIAIPSFEALSDQVTASYVCKELRERPQLQKDSRIGQLNSPYLISFCWELETPLPVSGLPIIVSTMPVQDPLKGIAEIDRLNPDLFFGKELSNQDIPLKLATASLWWRSETTQQLLFQKRPDVKYPDQLVHALNGQDSEAVVAFKILIGEQHLAAATQRFKAPPPPRAQHKLGDQPGLRP
ncbi:hypothetical protein [Chitinophaga rhizosphaerae]|uniref:hypothetical protein n=1 Tax=Chitinophaga rhizosphaerae TaxID=1864947 RepID=UPI000F7FD5E6|nr:hypothetical protein [Chitinophaga rhizosphaerae]